MPCLPLLLTATALTAIALAGYDITLEIDGGVGVANIKEIAEAGVDMFVAGSAIFNSERARVVRAHGCTCMCTYAYARRLARPVSTSECVVHDPIPTPNLVASECVVHDPTPTPNLVAGDDYKTTIDAMRAELAQVA